jgi:putative addiction module component (TIGR02574 family)
MGTKEILQQALGLKPEERFVVAEGLLRSLDKPDNQLDELWLNEAEKRLKAYREGSLKGIPMESIFSKESLQHRRPDCWVE